MLQHVNSNLKLWHFRVNIKQSEAAFGFIATQTLNKLPEELKPAA